MDRDREEQLTAYMDELRKLEKKAMAKFDKARAKYDDAMLKYEQGDGPKPKKKPEYKEPEVLNVREKYPLLKHVGRGRTRRGRKSRSTRRR